MVEEQENNRALEYNSVEEARQKIEEQFKDLLEVILDRFEKIFSPFEFQPIKEIIDQILERTGNYCQSQKADLQKLFEFKVEKVYPIADKQLLEYDNYQKYMGVDEFNELPKDEVSPTLNNFLGQ